MPAPAGIASEDGVTPYEVEWPDAAPWLSALRASPLVDTPHQPERRPLVLDDAGRLYLRRYFGEPDETPCELCDVCRGSPERPAAFFERRESLNR